MIANTHTHTPLKAYKFQYPSSDVSTWKLAEDAPTAIYLDLYSIYSTSTKKVVNLGETFSVYQVRDGVIYAGNDSTAPILAVANYKNNQTNNFYSINKDGILYNKTSGNEWTFYIKE